MGNRLEKICRQISTRTVAFYICLGLAGCVSDPGTLEYLNEAERIALDEAPAEVRKAIEGSLGNRSVVHLEHYPTLGNLDYYKVQFSDSTVTKFDKNGSTVFWGVL